VTSVREHRRATQSTIRNVDELRAAIDHSAANDKVSFPDPAAAPLGTDDEAAGAPASVAQVRLAAKEELGRNARLRRSFRSSAWPYLVLGLLALILAILAAEALALISR
jgi:hypothetical protein